MVSRLFKVVLLSAALPITLIAQGAAPAPATAGARKALTINDYSRWRSIEGAELSPDGKWVAYALRYTNTLPADSKPVLHLVNLETNQDLEVPNAHTPSFSSDSRWVVYQVDSVPARRRGWPEPPRPRDRVVREALQPRHRAWSSASLRQGAHSRGSACSPANSTPRPHISSCAAVWRQARAEARVLVLPRRHRQAGLTRLAAPMP